MRKITPHIRKTIGIEQFARYDRGKRESEVRRLLKLGTQICEQILFNITSQNCPLDTHRRLETCKMETANDCFSLGRKYQTRAQNRILG